MSRLQNVQSPDQAGTEEVSLARIKDMPVHIRNTSRNLTEILTGVARNSPGKIPPVLLGRVDGDLYVMNDFEAVAAMKRARIRIIRAVITDHPSIVEMITDHVHRNFTPQAVDPLRLHYVADFMEQSGVKRDEIDKILWIDQRPDLLDALHAEISEGAKDVLLNMADQISGSLQNVVIPPYYITKIARISPGEQEAAAAEIASYTVPKTRSAAKSAWPAPDAIETLMIDFERKKSTVPAERRIASKEGKEKPDRETVRNAEKFIADDPNLIFIARKDVTSDMVIHKKTGRIFDATEMHSTYSLVGDKGIPVSALPRGVSRFLGAENEKLSVYKYSSVDKLKDALKRSGIKGARFAVVTSARLPRR